MSGTQSNLTVGDVVVQTTALTRTFGDLIAVDHVTLSVNRCEIFGLIGPNGAGKSTLIKMLTTLLPPSSGIAMVAGYDIHRHWLATNRSPALCGRESGRMMFAWFEAYRRTACGGKLIRLGLDGFDQIGRISVAWRRLIYIARPGLRMYYFALACH